MFTGLIQDIGTVRRLEKSGDWRIEIATSLERSALAEGASVACSGVCLTVIKSGRGWFAAQISQETLDKTTLSLWREGTKINLEPSLRMGDALGGHFVFGHADGLAVLEEITPEKDSHRLMLSVPDPLKRYIASKGSVALDGVSLTVNEVENRHFGVNIIPHTWEKTILGQKKQGDALNLEVDMLARYVARSLEVSSR